MKFVLYGLPCSGKTTLLHTLNCGLRIINGSSWLDQYTNGNFESLSPLEKEECRIKYVEYIHSINEDIITDGHYAFDTDIVFTQNDGDVYDVFLYLYCEPNTLLNRLHESNKNIRFASLSLEQIRNWQNFEIENLRNECHNRNKDFYVIPSNTITSYDFDDFIYELKRGFSSYKLAEKIVDRTISWYQTPCDLCIVDGDNTYIKQDTLRVCSNGYVTKSFDGNFYTSYQSYCFIKEIKSIALNPSKLEDIELNDVIINEIKNKKYIILSAGITELWQQLSIKFDEIHIIASPEISSDTKYYVVKLLKARGYCITAYGDNKIDYYMLKEANMGFLYIGEKLSRSFDGCDVSDLKLLYDKTPYILSESSNVEIEQNIEICKSSSGIMGSRLARAHFELGLIIGEQIKKRFPNINAAVIIMERSGRFFGDGLYLSFGGKLYPYHKGFEALPIFESNLVIIVDGVINTGKSILELICELKRINSNINICVATNVIQREAVSKFKDYKLFAVRISENKFIGTMHKKQIGEIGPDTGDRLFNLL